MRDGCVAARAVDGGRRGGQHGLEPALRLARQLQGGGMFRSKRVPIFVIVAMVVPLIASRAGASDESDNDNGGLNSATVLIKGVETFRPNFFQQTFRFPEDPTEIKS